MIRRFIQHNIRSVTSLDGLWDFAFLGDVAAEGIDLSHIRYDDRMAVPGCFDALPQYAGKRGLAAYRTAATIADRTPHRLIIDGLHHWGRIFVDGKRLTDHAGGFTQFATDFVPGRTGEIEIVVLVDNRFDPARSPLHLEYYDWYHFGGITRGVELHRLGPAWIDSLEVVTLDYRKRLLGLKARLRVQCPIQQGQVSLSCDGTRVLSIKLAAKKMTPASPHLLEQTFTLPKAKLWSPEAPHLHMLEVQLRATVDGEKISDDLRERIGIRQVRVKGREIQINGTAIQLRGFCRHESHPQFGHSIPDAVMLADLGLLRDMHCNFVRGSHYPQDVRFLDLCDEFGICVWNEATGWGQKIEHVLDESFVRAQITNIEEMVATAINRPSVIMWGILNEGPTNDEKARPIYETLLGRLRQLDSSRPVTFASMFAALTYRDKCLDLADIVSVNLYPGWYWDTIEEIPRNLDTLLGDLDTHGLGDRPLILSEVGAAALYGWRDQNQARFSEQYQARLLENVIRYVLGHSERICGLAIWQFCDIRTTESMPLIISRPRGFNNKGVMDEYRRPKMAYDVVKRLFEQSHGKQT